MPQSHLVSLQDVKDILNTIEDGQLVQFDGALCTQTRLGDQTISIVEAKVAFIQKDTDGDNKSPDAGGDAQAG